MEEACQGPSFTTLFLLTGAVMKKTIFLIGVLFLLPGCMGQSGRLHLNRDVALTLEACTVLPGYDYYYNGPDAQPNTILGVKKSYTFKKGLWKAVALDKDQLCDWMTMIDPLTRKARHRYDGYTIFSAEGDEVGIWYSREDHTVVKEENGELIIYTPIDRVQPNNHRF